MKVTFSNRPVTPPPPVTVTLVLSQEEAEALYDAANLADIVGRIADEEYRAKTNVSKVLSTLYRDLSNGGIPSTRARHYSS